MHIASKKHGYKRAILSLFGQDVDTFTQNNAPQSNEEHSFVSIHWNSRFNTSEITLLQHLGPVKKSVLLKETLLKDSMKEGVNQRDDADAMRVRLIRVKTLDVDLVETEEKHGSKTTEQTTSLLANNAELKAQIQEKFQSTADGSKPKPRSNNQTSRSLPVSKSTRVTITAVPKADHSKSSSSFSDSKQFVCSTCHNEDGNPVEPTSNKALGGFDDGVAASLQQSRIHKPHAHTQAFKYEMWSRAQVDQESQIKMIQVKEIDARYDLQELKGQKIKAQDQDHKA
ncbi:hypothetical protein Tco_0723224 [Tanacetum coccineum]